MEVMFQNQNIDILEKASSDQHVWDREVRATGSIFAVLLLDK